ncbi:matrix protein [Yongjia Tick Virus 2]|uniref:Matrix protein n=1 Tax=Yongjia Tick Virus 2 TaxID=1608146 RepID=A0A0B5KKD9_9RHAB|nr:matrix protein [Yongjia Tick Virus 2]AJG39230.1 matrix protein [Yongjia Tick Virus 2]
MLSRFKKNGKSEKEALVPYGTPTPVSYFLGEPSRPSAPVEGPLKETLKTLATLEVRCHEGFESIEECLRVLEVWVDENRCPIWQVHLDTWNFLCLAVHLRKDPTCTYTNLYKAGFSEVVEYTHVSMVDGPVTYVEHVQRMEGLHKGQPCEIIYKSKMEPSKRRGVPAHLIYDNVIKSGVPPGIDVVSLNYPIVIEFGERGEHGIKFELP